ncbi:MAG: hypothetical protein JWM68_3898, partial [Verrucomicrobiales bacterium]|nr:hypothetical protein [Verrucomicrobiales bacterium]
TKPVRIPFEPKKNLTMIFGENGSGKSSIVDAFSFLCESKFGSLDDRSGTENSFITAITGTAKELKVKLTTDQGEWTGILKGRATIEVTPLKGLPMARILRRAQILQLIEQKPTDRYKALGQYIELPGVTKGEATLREGEKDARTSYGQAVHAYDQAGEALKALWEKEGKPGTNATDWAATEKAVDLTQIATQLTSSKTISDAIISVGTRRNDYDNAVSKEKTDSDEVTKADMALKNEEAKSAGQNSSLFGLLQKAKLFVESEQKAGECPVCQQQVNRAVLAGELGARIAAMETLGKLANEAKFAREKLTRSSTLVASSKGQYASSLKTCATLLVGSFLKPVTEADLPAETLEKLSDGDTTENERVSVGETMLPILTTLKGKLYECETEWQKRINQHNSIKLQHDTLLKKKSESEALEKFSTRMKLALDLVVEKRKAYVETELASISLEVERLYRCLHPGEKLGDISLGLDTRTQGSLHLKGNFYTEQNVAPQSLFSEAHLDTLGFCVFFALSKKYGTDRTFILLDDVVTSVDDPHLERFIELLHDEAQYFAHIVITTHYRPWRDRYRHQRAPANELHFIDLRPWSLEGGIRIHKEKIAIAELRDALAANDFNRRDVANQAGILVENVLDFLTFNYGCKLPRKADPKYTLGELLNSFSGELLKAMKVEEGAIAEVIDDATKKKTRTFTLTATKELKPFIERFRALACVRNQVGCHYNYDGANVNDKDVTDFGTAAADFAELLTCPDAGDLPNRKPSGSYWETRSGRRRLYPLETPPKN